MPSLKTISRYFLAIFLIGAGVMHFVRPEFYLRIMPDYLPWHRELVYLSGVAEIACGVGLLVPRWRNAAAWGTIALLIAVFPANIYLYQHPELIPGASPAMHLLRLPLQALFILWAWWQTGRSTVSRTENPTE